MRPVCLCILLLLLATAAHAQVAVIANKSVPVTEIDRDDLLDLYSGDIRVWETGEPVSLFDLKTKTNVKNAFYRFLGRSSSRMKSVWMKHMLSGEGSPPTACETEDEILANVAGTPGGVGYVSQSKVNGDVVILLVIPLSEE